MCDSRRDLSSTAHRAPLQHSNNRASALVSIIMRERIWTIGDRVCDVSRHGLVMGVLNITPDSFSDGGEFFSSDQAIEQGLRMAADGADIIDVGGESTLPGSEPIDADEELRRAAADGRFEDEGWRVRKDGSHFWANVVITALRDPLSRSSLWVRPGSRKCTWVSITPGRTCRPRQSTVLPADARDRSPSSTIREPVTPMSRAPSPS